MESMEFSMRHKGLIGITGVCGGIGSAMAREFIAREYKVVGLDLDEKGLANLSQTFPDYFHGIFCDMTKTETLPGIFDQLKLDLEMPKIWINNAGITQLGPLTDCDLNEFLKVIQINFTSLAIATHYWLGQMEKRQSGTIVNIASFAGHAGVPFMSAYSASKHAVVGFTRALQAEIKFKKSGVKMTLVSPGFVDTGIIRKGEARGFPSRLSFLLTSTQDCAREIVSGILNGKEFISPTATGKILKYMNRISPALPLLTARLGIAKSWKEMVGLKRIDF